MDFIESALPSTCMMSLKLEGHWEGLKHCMGGEKKARSYIERQVHNCMGKEFKLLDVKTGSIHIICEAPTEEVCKYFRFVQHGLVPILRTVTENTAENAPLQMIGRTVEELKIGEFLFKNPTRTTLMFFCSQRLEAGQEPQQNAPNNVQPKPNKPCKQELLEKPTSDFIQQIPGYLNYFEMDHTQIDVCVDPALLETAQAIVNQSLFATKIKLIAGKPEIRLEISPGDQLGFCT